MGDLCRFIEHFRERKHLQDQPPENPKNRTGLTCGPHVPGPTLICVSPHTPHIGFHNLISGATINSHPLWTGLRQGRSPLLLRSVVLLVAISLPALGLVPLLI